MEHQKTKKKIGVGAHFLLFMSCLLSVAISINICVGTFFQLWAPNTPIANLAHEYFVTIMGISAIIGIVAVMGLWWLETRTDQSHWADK